MVRSRWWFMNPMDWLKAIYETFGTPYPRASLACVMLLGAIAFGAVWVFAAKQVTKESHTVNSGSSAATAGSGIANTGNGNTINQSQSGEKRTPPK